MDIDHIIHGLWLFCFIKTADEFFHHLENVCGSSYLDIALRKPDKKKERCRSYVIFLVNCECLRIL